MNSRLLADPFWTVERAREIAERKSRKLDSLFWLFCPRSSRAELCALGFLTRLFRAPSRLSKRGPLAVCMANSFTVVSITHN